MSRFASNTVFSGFLATWFLAASPIRRSESVKATYEGVVLLPWSFAMISTPSFFQTPTHEYVVPKSIPTAVFFDIVRAGECPTNSRTKLREFQGSQRL